MTGDSRSFLPANSRPHRAQYGEISPERLLPVLLLTELAIAPGLGYDLSRLSSCDDMWLPWGSCRLFKNYDCRAATALS